MSVLAVPVLAILAILAVVKESSTKKMKGGDADDYLIEAGTTIHIKQEGQRLRRCPFFVAQKPLFMIYKAVFRS